MKSYSDEESEKLRERMTKEAVLLLEKCERSQRPDGRHDWRLMGYTQNVHSRPIHSMYSASVVGHECIGRDTTMQMMCFCGVSVDVKCEGR